MKKVKEKLNIENLLTVFIILCPILDIASFIFRNIFNTKISPSTIIRPILPIIAFIYYFIKADKKYKLKLFGISAIYGIYAIIHLILFTTVKSECSYSNISHELQYLVNYTFMIIILYVFIKTFKEKLSTEKLEKATVISVGIYLLSIILSIITNTMSSTYIEGMGIKGWFESGNSISATLILSMYILLMNKNKKYKKIIITELILMGIFLTMLIGTRVGLYGFILTIGIFVLVKSNIFNINKINKKIVIAGGALLALIILIICLVGSNTFTRRQHLKDIEANIVDSSNNEEAHLTGSLIEIKDKIDNKQIDEKYMNEVQQKSVLELYDIANKLQISNNDQRMQQLLYNAILVKNQANLLLILFGNGYMNQFRELVLEMDIPAFLFNFGIIGLFLYFVPFLSIFIYALYWAIKRYKIIDEQYIMYLLGLGLSFALSVFSGYVFFNMSTDSIIIVICVLLLNKVEEVKKEEI
ncbi:MAG: O-antigen ligase family protein [Clostridia bacterium]|nr:O-antigen ligase family protein [Clostridium sp.]